MCLNRNSMRVLRARGLPSACGERLLRDSNVHAEPNTGHGDTSAPLARRQPADQLQVRRVQEDVLDVRVPGGHEMRVVRHHGSLHLPPAPYRRVQLRQPQRHYYSSLCGLFTSRRHEQRDLARHSEQSSQR